MRLIITGGGTGGHIYPALEVARLAAEYDAEILYFGSFRGQEAKAAKAQKIPFTAFPSEPLYSLRSYRGLRALFMLQKSRKLARVALKDAAPDVVFSTGGYSAGPVVAAAMDLKIPYVIHSSDSIPARSSSMFAKGAAAFTCVFQSTVEYMPEIPIVRTGQPIRQELRAAARVKRDGEPFLLIMGGSQGSQFLNDIGPRLAAEDPFETPVLHICGPNNVGVTCDLVDKLHVTNRYHVTPYLETGKMVDAYLQASVVVARSGGTLAELALFGIPSVLVPLPKSANNHQLHNAMEFVNMQAATMIQQSEANPTNMAEAAAGWLYNQSRREVAKRNLRDWHIPDATQRIYNLIEVAAK